MIAHEKAKLCGWKKWFSSEPVCLRKIKQKQLLEVELPKLLEGCICNLNKLCGDQILHTYCSRDAILYSYHFWKDLWDFTYTEGGQKICLNPD